jgi:GMP synthase (glutamine-hydrolysing)
MAEKLPVLLFQLGEAPDPVKRVFGTYPTWYERAWGGPLQVHDGRAAGRSPDPKDFAGIVITGSRSSLAEPPHEPWVDEAADLVRRAHACGTPTLGVCFGHQLVAHAFGARVVRNPKGWEIGSHDIEVNDHGRTDPLFDGLPPRLRVNLTHEDIVDPDSLAGTGLTNLAKSARCDIQVLAVDDHVRTVQFHPEIDGAICRAYILARKQLLADQDPDALLAATVDSAHGVTVMKNFKQRFVKP